MEAYFASIFEVVRHERSLLILLWLTDLDILRQGKFTDVEIDITKILPPEKLHRQRILKEVAALPFSKNNFLINQYSCRNNCFSD